MIIDGSSLKIEDVVRVARFGEKVECSQESIKRVEENRRTLERIIGEGKTIYGINTGLGELVRVRIPEQDIRRLQVNLVRSHSSGVGPEMPVEVVRGAMLIRANSLLNAHSGVRPEVIRILVEFLNEKITPVVPMYGSVGASGDLAPLAHIALALIGEGEVIYQGRRMKTAGALGDAGIEPIELREKEGLALLNGTAVMASYASLAVWDSYRIMEHAVSSASMAYEALRGTDAALDPRIMEARPHPGQIRVARALRELLADSDIVKEARREKVQDAYTLRCIPQVYGAVLDTIDYVRGVVEREINSVTDNPLIFDEAISGGNFHGEPIALAMDFLSIAMVDLGNMIERKIARLVDDKLSGLPAFLIENSGLNSGLMIPQYTAAALCNRNKVLAYPASADTIPTSANQEDHVSMGMTSAQKLREIVENVKYIEAIELLCVNQALHLAGSSAKANQIAMDNLGIEKFKDDAVFSETIENIKNKIDSGAILKGIKTTL